MIFLCRAGYNKTMRCIFCTIKVLGFSALPFFVKCSLSAFCVIKNMQKHPIILTKSCQ